MVLANNVATAALQVGPHKANTYTKAEQLPAPPASEPLVKQATTGSGRVRLLTLNRPRALNSVSRALASELFAALDDAERDPAIRTIVLTGSGKAFCAGADIKELKDLTVESAFDEDWLANWAQNFAKLRKPVIAAVNGYALGGGAELALMCDIIYCSASAQFGLPEITLGTIPGAGGTQRLLHIVGKSRASEMILTGDRMLAKEAHERGVVARIFSDDELHTESIAMAERIAKNGATALRYAKEALGVAQRIDTDGLQLERRLYHMTFGSQDFTEGTTAFVEKRAPKF